MASVTRRHPPSASRSRNLLSDLDALVERTVVASEEGRDPKPFLEDAVRVARELAGPCASDDPEHITRAVTFLTADKLQEHKAMVEARVRSGLAAAIRYLDKLDVRRCEKQASAVKYFVRSVACACTRPTLSRSGRQVW